MRNRAPFWKHLGWACLGMWIWAVIAALILSELYIKAQGILVRKGTRHAKRKKPSSTPAEGLMF